MPGLGYPDTRIYNSTGYNISGEVVYAACSDGEFNNLGFGQSWGEFRGGCLITRITANVVVGGQSIAATPYTSSGTSYSQFVVVNLGNNKFAVSRLTDGGADASPADYVEPEGAMKK